MPRIADALDRESQSVDLERGDFERLLERRERKQRNRRIGAGAVAVIVALATAALLTRYIAWEHVPATPPKPLGAGEVLTRDEGPERAGSRQRRDAHDRRSRVAPRARRGHHRRRMVIRPKVGRVPWPDGLWVADTVGGAPRQLTPDLGWSPWAWSPTEDQLVVRARPRCDPHRRGDRS